MSFMEGVQNFVTSHSDPHTVNWNLSSGWTPVIVLTIYFIVCFVLLPPYIMKREPMQMANFLIVYNASILLSNLGLFLYFTYYAITGKYSIICQPVGGDDEILNTTMAAGFYAYLVSKMFELTDSIIILLRQKKAQTNCLHFYHHSTMVLIIWLGLRFLPGGSSVILGAINTFFHVITYLYFHMVTFKLRRTDMSSFKTIATMSQIIQFCMGILHCITILVKNCGYPRQVGVFLIFYIGSFIVLHFAKGCMASLHLRPGGIFSIEGLPPNGPGVSITSIEQYGESKSHHKLAKDASSVFLPQPAGTPSNSGKKNPSKKVSKSKQEAQETKIIQITSTTTTNQNNDIDNNPNPPDPQQDTSNKGIHKDKQIVTTVLEKFQHYLSQSSPPIPEDPMERLVYQGMKKFGNKNVMTKTKSL